MTDDIQELEEQLRIAKEKKVLSEGGFKCVKCGRTLESKDLYSAERSRYMRMISPSLEDPSHTCQACAAEQYMEQMRNYFSDLETEPQAIEIVKIKFLRSTWDANERDKIRCNYDYAHLSEVVFKIGKMYFELELEGPYDVDEMSELHFRFIGFEGDKRVDMELRS